MNIKLLFFCIISYLLLLPKAVEAVYIKYNNPVLTTGNLNSWDSQHVNGSHVLFDSNLFKLWYGGDNGVKLQIGFSTSSTPFDFIRFPNNPVLKWDSISQTDVGLAHPSVIIFNTNNTTTYHIWVDNVQTSYSNFKLYHSTSTDGVNWSNLSPVILSPFDTTWDTTGQGAPSVLYRSDINEYQLWYVARGIWNGVTHWRIGYATSPDGITWVKHPVPVLETVGGWEGVDVANPSVLFDETTKTYEMFYHGDYGIGRATSPDGITWTRDPSNPILTPSANTFDSVRVFNPYVLKKDGIYYMWYTGVNNERKWQIGLATSEPIPPPLPSATPTIAPSPTVSPSLTPSATPTTVPTITITPSPTPTQGFSPIVIIPGLGASWNPKDIFSCSIDSSGIWELAPYVSLYNRLIKTLTDNAGFKLNKDVYFYTYDWRKLLPQQAVSFKNYLDNIRINRPGDTKFRVIGHSLGGLIIRSYLSSYPADNHIVSVLTVGTPHLGTLVAFPIWEKGEVAVDDMLLQIAITQVINHCRVVRTFIPPKRNVFRYRFKTAREVVQYLVPVVKQLLPVFDYLRQNNQIKPVSQLVHQNDWIREHLIPVDNYNIPFDTLSGENTPTTRFIDVVNPSNREKVLGEWLDGKPAGFEKINSGDGTVLNLSSQIKGVNNEIIASNHTELVSSDTGITKILNFLGLSQISIASAAISPEETSEKALTISTDQDAQIKITDPRRRLLEVRENIFVSYNPSPGLYRLEITSNRTSEAFLHLSEIVRDKEPQSKSFSMSLTKFRPSRFYLIYNPANSTPFNLIPL